MELLLSKSAQTPLKALLKNPGGSYLFVGSAHIGKAAAAKNLAAQLTTHASDVIVVEPEGKSLGIDAIHGLRQQLQLKRLQAAGERVVIVDNAELLTREAQNAFLKLLEEPPGETTIILVATNKGAMLPTIISRCRLINFEAPPTDKAVAFLVQKCQLSEAEARQFYELAGGAIGLALGLQADEEQAAIHRLVRETTQALLGEETFGQTLLMQKVISESRAPAVLQALTEALRQQLRQQAQESDHQGLAKTCHHLQVLDFSQRYLEANGNPKFAVDNMVLELMA